MPKSQQSNFVCADHALEQLQRLYEPQKHQLMHEYEVDYRINVWDDRPETELWRGFDLIQDLVNRM